MKAECDRAMYLKQGYDEGYPLGFEIGYKEGVERGIERALAVLGISRTEYEQATGGEKTEMPVKLSQPEKQQSEKKFPERVYEVVQRIPAGKVATYGQVARLAGSPKASRIVGQALHVNPSPGVIPCHRVVFASGELAESFAFGGAEAQRELLLGEGVAFVDDMHVDLASCQWEA